MVGVPSFLKWDSGPTLRMLCPTCRLESLLISHGPMMNESTSAVMVAYMVRNVMNRNT